jgi:large subunit ribosomal protein L10
MAITREKKEQILQELTDHFSRAKSVVFAKNLGLSVAEVSALRRVLRENGIVFKVSKKTLFRKAAEAQGIKNFSEDVLDGAVGAAFCFDDEIAPAKILAKFLKDTKKIDLVAGILEGKALTGEEVKDLAKLPSKEELISKFMGSLQAPLSGFVGVSSNLLSGFVRALDQVRQQKESA